MATSTKLLENSRIIRNRDRQREREKEPKIRRRPANDDDDGGGSGGGGGGAGCASGLGRCVFEWRLEYLKDVLEHRTVHVSAYNTPSQTNETTHPHPLVIVSCLQMSHLRLRLVCKDETEPMKTTTRAFGWFVSLVGWLVGWLAKNERCKNMADLHKFDRIFAFWIKLKFLRHRVLLCMLEGILVKKLLRIAVRDHK